MIFIVALVIFLMLLVHAILPPAARSFVRYRARTAVRCPETALTADVQVDALHAAMTSFAGPPELRIRDCSLWPHRRNCDQRCLNERT